MESLKQQYLRAALAALLAAQDEIDRLTGLAEAQGQVEAFEALAQILDQFSGWRAALESDLALDAAPEEELTLRGPEPAGWHELVRRMASARGLRAIDKPVGLDVVGPHGSLELWWEGGRERLFVQGEAEGFPRAVESVCELEAMLDELGRGE